MTNSEKGLGGNIDFPSEITMNIVIKIQRLIISIGIFKTIIIIGKHRFVGIAIYEKINKNTLKA